MNRDEIERNFTYHPPKEGQPERYQKIREKAKELALLINAESPDCREKSIAMTELESSVFWVNAAIARNDHLQCRKVYVDGKMHVERTCPNCSQDYDIYRGHSCDKSSEKQLDEQPTATIN